MKPKAIRYAEITTTEDLQKVNNQISNAVKCEIKTSNQQ